MKTLLTFALASFTILSFSQTDIIELRSRNTSLKKYERAIEYKSVDHVASNFGMMPPDRNLKRIELDEMSLAVLDSVKCISDEVAIMYTSNYCTKFPVPTPRVGTKWQAGADTVFNHPLFSKRHSLDSVKTVLDRDYIFNFPSDSTKFIGFDNNQEKIKEDVVLPVKHKDEKKNSFGWELLFMLITPALFAFSFGRFLIPNPVD